MIRSSETPRGAIGSEEPPAAKSLARRSFVTLFLLSLAVMVTAVLAATAASYSSYEREAEDYLLAQTRTCAASLEGKSAQDMVEALQALPLTDTRVTLVAADGTVLFDSAVDASTLTRQCCAWRRLEHRWRRSWVVWAGSWPFPWW